MVRCIAIDDEPLALRQIKSYIERNDQLERENKQLQKRLAELERELASGQMRLF